MGDCNHPDPISKSYRALVAENSRLRAKADLLGILIKRVPTPVAMLDAEMRYLAYSDRWLTDYRLGDQNLIGRSHYDVFPEIPQRWREFHQRALDGIPSSATEDSFVRADGAVEWLNWECVPWHDSEGEVGGLVIFSEVVTAEVLARQALRDSQQMLRNILENFPGVVFWKDRNLTYLGCNIGFALGAGLQQRADIVGKTDFDLPWGPHEGEAYRQHDRQVMESGQARLGIIETMHQADGSIVWYETNKAPIFDAAGAVIGVFGIATDITEQKNAEKSLRYEQALLTSGIDLLPFPMLFADADGTLVRVNRAALPFVQQFTSIYKLAEGITLRETGSGRKISTGEWPIHRALRGEIVNSVEYDIVMADGRARTITMQAAAIVMPDERIGVVLAWQDTYLHPGDRNDEA